MYQHKIRVYRTSWLSRTLPSAREPLEGEDPLGESADLIEMKTFLLRRGVASLEADRIVGAFASFPTGGERLVTWEQREAALLERKRWLVDGPRKAVSKDEQLLIAPWQRSKAATEIAETAMAMLEPSAAGVGQAERSSNGVASVRGYVISISGKRRVRRLHFVGLCQ